MKKLAYNSLPLLTTVLSRTCIGPWAWEHEGTKKLKHVCVVCVHMPLRLRVYYTRKHLKKGAKI